MPVLYYRDPADQIFKAVNTGVSIAGSNPIGTIVPYAGGSAPAGWHLCDGSAHGSSALEALIGSPNTPDLRGKFILGVSAGHPAKETGGAETHTHPLSDAGHAKIASDAPSGTNLWSRAIAVASWTATRVNAIGASAANSNPIAGGAALGGSTDAGSSMPPYYALVYIIKKFETAAPSGISQSEADARYAPVQVTGRNRIINGDFSVNQRGIASAINIVGGAPAYGYDRWCGTANNGTANIQNGVPVAGELPEGALAYQRIACTGQDVSSGYTQLIQKIEGVATLSGKTVTVSFWAKANTAGLKVWGQFAQVFATGTPATVNIPMGSVTLSTAWTRYSMTVALPSMAGKTNLGLNSALELHFWVSAGTSYSAYVGPGSTVQAGTFDFWGVQVEEGPIATPYEQKTYGQELLACQRYFVRLNADATAIATRFGFGNASDAANFTAMVPLAVPLRVRPITYWGGPMNASDGVTGKTISALSTYPVISPVFTNAFVNLVATSSGLTVGKFYWLEAGSSAAAYIQFDAEL